MKLLSEVYAGDTSVVIIETLEISSAGQPSFYLCNGFTRQNLYVNEAGTYVQFDPTSIAIKPMDRDNRGAQSVTFILDNALGDVQTFIDKSTELGKEINVFARMYLSDDKSRQASNTISAKVKEVRIERGQVEVTAGFFDMLNTNFNRTTYNSETAPCIRYL